uniref:Uncharacterized protein n=1 Tax=Lygus hesperus TaxID=30085 RepID=A0A0A9WP87_LYGHE
MQLLATTQIVIRGTFHWCRGNCCCCCGCCSLFFNIFTSVFLTSNHTTTQSTLAPTILSISVLMCGIIVKIATATSTPSIHLAVLVLVFLVVPTVMCITSTKGFCPSASSTTATTTIIPRRAVVVILFVFTKLFIFLVVIFTSVITSFATVCIAPIIITLVVIFPTITTSFITATTTTRSSTTITTFNITIAVIVVRFILPATCIIFCKVALVTWVTLGTCSRILCRFTLILDPVLDILLRHTLLDILVCVTLDTPLLCPSVLIDRISGIALPIFVTATIVVFTILSCSLGFVIVALFAFRLTVITASSITIPGSAIITFFVIVVISIASIIALPSYRASSILIIVTRRTMIVIIVVVLVIVVSVTIIPTSTTSVAISSIILVIFSPSGTIAIKRVIHFLRFTGTVVSIIVRRLISVTLSCTRLTGLCCVGVALCYYLIFVRVRR